MHAHHWQTSNRKYTGDAVLCRLLANLLARSNSGDDAGFRDRHWANPGASSSQGDSTLNPARESLWPLRFSWEAISTDMKDGNENRDSMTARSDLPVAPPEDSESEESQRFDCPGRTRQAISQSVKMQTKDFRTNLHAETSPALPLWENKEQGDIALRGALIMAALFSSLIHPGHMPLGTRFGSMRFPIPLLHDVIMLAAIMLGCDEFQSEKPCVSFPWRLLNFPQV